MEKIIAGLEDWDSIIDYYRPNASSKTWYLNEIKQIHIPMMWGDWNIFAENGKMFDRHNFVTMVTPDWLLDYVNFLPKEKIEGYHLYMIHVFSPRFFYENYQIGFSCIDEKYKNDIRNKKCKIVIFYTFEGYCGITGNYDFETVEKWRINENFPEDSIYMVTGNIIGEKIIKEKNLKINHFGVSMFEIWNWDFTISDINKTKLQYNPIDQKNLFLSYNRVKRGHRIKMISKLMEKNLFDRGLVSLNKVFLEEIMGDNEMTMEIKNRIANETPYVIDQTLDLNYNLACKISREDYEKTFISLVSETIVSSNTLFVSEKTWKPITVGHPFMIFGNKDILKYLKSRGYRTFDKWIDESYDDCDDENTRRDLILKEIEKFSTYSVEQLKEIRNEMDEICEHNKKLFFDDVSVNWRGQINLKIINYLYKIWESLVNKTPEFKLNEKIHNGII